MKGHRAGFAIADPAIGIVRNFYIRIGRKEAVFYV